MNSRMWTVIRGVFAGVLVLALAGCGALPFMASMMDPGDSTGMGASNLSFDLTGAKALAGTAGSTRSLTGARSISVEDEAALVKILDDGSVANAIDFGDDSEWAPEISFMYVGEDGSVYVGFQDSYRYWFDNQEYEVQLVRIRPDSSDYEVIWPLAGTETNDTGYIDTWGAEWMNQDPMIVGPDGKLYFKVTNWANSTQSDHIYRYDPSTDNAVAERVTPERATLTINQFAIDSRKHLFVQSQGWDGDASYLRFYTEGVIGFQNIYYASNNDMWVRGFETAPDGSYIVMNGENIRGMRGIIRANLDEAEIEYELLYGSTNSDWIRLYTHYTDTWEKGTEIIDQLEDYTHEWRDDVLDDSNNLDEQKLIDRVSVLFYEQVTTVDPFVMAGDLTAGDATHPTYPDRTLADWIRSYPKDFLRTYFGGAKLFLDWLQENGLSHFDFQNIGEMVWAQSGALYALYNPSWWGDSTSDAMVVKLLDADGNRDLTIVSLRHADKVPSMIQVHGNQLYYRYAILDGAGQETGTHRLAHFDIETSQETEVLPADVADMEILSYDVASDDSAMYFLGLDPQTNEVTTGHVDMVSGTWEPVESSLRLSNIKIIE